MLALYCLELSVVVSTLIVLCCSSELYGQENGLHNECDGMSFSHGANCSTINSPIYVALK